MVDVYLATYNSKKGLFGSKKQVAEDIVQNPQNYHIYDGMSAMTNISRYVGHCMEISKWQKNCEIVTLCLSVFTDTIYQIQNPTEFSLDCIL